MRWRLSLLMFLMYSPAGALVPLFTLRLRELGFTPLEIGVACATQAMAGLVAPVIVGQIADRWVAAERCLTLCAFVACGFLWFLAELTAPAAVAAVALGFWLFMVPCLTLGTALCFAHLPSPVRDFAPVRFWGTVGWVVPGWLLGYWFGDPSWLAALVGWLRPGQPGSLLRDAFRLGSLFALVLGLYSLTLPHTPPSRRASHWLAPLAALELLRRRNFAVYCASCLLLCVTVPFSSQVTPLLLRHLGIPQPWISPTLTIGQSMELASLAVLPMLLYRLGVRGTMLLGLGAWVLALAMLTIGWPVGLVVGSQALNGLCVCCFLVAGQVFINGQARGEIRVSAQALLSFASSLGLLIGNLLVGWVRRQVHEEFPPTYAVATAIAAALAVGFFVGFRGEEAQAEVKLYGDSR